MRFEIVEHDDTEMVMRTDDELALDAGVVNLVMEAIRINPGWAEHWLELAEYMVFTDERWGDA